MRFFTIASVLVGVTSLSACSGLGTKNHAAPIYDRNNKAANSSTYTQSNPPQLGAIAKQKYASNWPREHSLQIMKAHSEGNLRGLQANWQALSDLLGASPLSRPALFPELTAKELKNLSVLAERGAEVEAPADQATDSSGVSLAADTKVRPVSIPANQQQWLRAEVKRMLWEFGEAKEIEPSMAFLSQVEGYVQAFTGNGNLGKWYRRSLARMNKYQPLIKGTFAEKRLPESMYYLALVESGFNPTARSHAGAVGMWQFMPATGRHYGLRVDRYRDDRRDPKKATVAAREYLHDLIMDFGDGHSMLLAMAAYNAGEGRIRSRLRRLDDFKDRNYWTLTERKMLPKETRDYIPKILAAAIVGRHPARFGLPDASYHSAGNLVLYRPVSVNRVIATVGLDKKTLLAMNPDLAENTVTIGSTEGYLLKLPAHLLPRAKADRQILAAMTTANNNIAANAYTNPVKVASTVPYKAEAVSQVAGKSSSNALVAAGKTTTANRSSTMPSVAKTDAVIIYTVKRGNHWQGVSSWSGVSISKLKADNPRVARRGLHVGDKLYLRNAKPLKRYHHRVVRNDTLAKIAGRYGVGMSQLKSWNGRSKGTVYKGERLVVYVDARRNNAVQLSNTKASGGTAKSAKNNMLPNTRFTYYTVQSGNTLGSIASAFGTNVSSLRKANGLSNNNIRPGQKLQIPVGVWKKQYTTVRAGQTLGKIAAKFGVSTAALKTCNGLRSSRIYVGEKLVVYLPV